MQIRQADMGDVDHFVTVFELASEGLSNHFWQKTAGPAGDPRDVARTSMTRKLTGAAPGSALVCTVDGQFAGGVYSYGIGQEPEQILPQEDPMVVPMIELENQALGTWYVNAIAVLPEFQGGGLGAAMMNALSQNDGPNGMSLIAYDHNHSARRFYQRLGFRDRASRPVVAGESKTECTDLVLMIRDAA